MLVLRTNRRAVIDLTLALAIALVLAILNISINYMEDIHTFFQSYSKLHVTEFLINFLFIWLAALLLLCFWRWRESSRRRAELENIVSSISPDTLLVVDPSRTIRLCNASVERIFGYAPDTVVGKKTDLLYRDRRSAEATDREVYESLNNQGFHVGEATGMHRDGRNIPLEIITGDISGRGGAVILIRDITVRKKAENEKLKLDTRMRRQQKMESLGVLAGGIAHDFNNLLTVIMGNAEIALSDLPPSSDVTESIQGIVGAARHAAELCTQMLSYSGHGRLTFELTDLSSLVGKMKRLIQVPLLSKTVIEFELAQGIPLVEADPEQIQHVLMNLVSNAAEAIGNEAGTVTVKTGLTDGQDTLTTDFALTNELSPGVHVFLEVSDTGCGMDEETRAKMFDPFYTTKFTGRGMGLASVLGVVRAHSGAIQVESEPAKGTVFRVLLKARHSE
ncbi:MAG: PAS domain S-box protein [Lentisphaerae bacterium]|nr:PAS domain S-box protein [Lentisphaerota bacterium]